ncbi:GNAT family acetyltransferase [Penicillium cinerascens]|uniref:GNAT family acetyltransferase n=1 Tax=Penicillium cinerascens TaxID=70096 RepID=A0A9W9NH46_9EURO|nr:GNAT family acetyltransferase [Penicillium cinerascens]KAJ5218498.1 GNAT family acetyltransferase [Penicillium cinerascens]
MDPSFLEPYRSKRLLYRAPEDNEKDNAFYQALRADPDVLSMASNGLQRPLSTKEQRQLRVKMDKMMMTVMICIIPDDENSDKEPETIGIMSLKYEDPILVHNRSRQFGITIARRYQGNGYGPEAIAWLLDWCFMTAGLHRVELTVYEWNERAQNAYKKLGFVTEGRKRESLWKAGRWRDTISMGILSHEWEAKKMSTVSVPVC